MMLSTVPLESFKVQSCPLFHRDISSQGIHLAFVLALIIYISTGQL
jgi:hypothetical protein